ncbi:VOC family protein [Rhodococcus sp. 24CO]|uniref:VOC family protein n=1 Tax=Rhodococcus sp. 24CO TaxID=3117460 RepID=UPI003D350270
MAVAHLGSITLDCDNPETLAAFWRDLLDGEITYSSEKFVVVKIAQGLLTMMRVSDHLEPSWPGSAVPKQLHLDLVVADLDAAEAEAVRLGARIASEQFAPEQCRVLLDPAGHPFCLSLPQNFSRVGG